MYSNFGRGTEKIFPILREKPQILSSLPRKPALKPQTLNFTKKRLSPETMQGLVLESHAAPTPPRRDSPTSSFTTQTRSTFYKATNNSGGPPPGHYDCNYKLVRQHTRVTDFRPRPRTQSRAKRSPPASSVTPQEQRRHVPSPVSFAQQLPRSSARKNRPETRRLSEATPIVVHSKRCRTPDFAKSRAREQGHLTTNLLLVSYTPCFKLVSEDLGRVPSFVNYNARGPLLLSHLANSWSYRPSYKLIDKRVPSPDLSKGASRPARCN